MSTGKFLTVIVVLAIALAIIRWILGDSIVATVVFFVVMFFTFELVRGERRWLAALMGGLLAAGVFTLLMKLQPPNTVPRILGTIAIVSSPVLGPLIEQRLRRRRAHQSRS